MTFYKEHYALVQFKCCLKFRSSRWLAGVLPNRSSQKFRKFSLAQPTCFFMCRLIFSAPRSNSKCYKHSFKNNSVDPV